MAECSRISPISLFVTPLRMAPSRWSSSSSALPSATSIAIFSMLRIRRGSPGRDHTIPQADLVARICIGMEDASRATPPPGKALVFVFRSERETVAALVPVFVNLARVGDLANGTFAVATVSPGRTFLRVGDQAVATYTLEVAANQSYFVRVEAVPGVRPVQTEVRIVSEVEGRRFLAQSRPVGAAPRVPPPPAPVVAPRVPPPPAPVVAPRVPPPPAPAVAAPRVE